MKAPAENLTCGQTLEHLDQIGSLRPNANIYSFLILASGELFTNHVVC